MFLTRMKVLLVIFTVLSVSKIGDGLFQMYPKKDGISRGYNLSKPAFLTPYIESGDLTGGQKAANVPPLLENIISYSGFLTVNKEYNSNLYFWFFPAESDNATAPLVIWLQGGPGGSSLFGLFEEHGPFYIDNNYKLVKRDYYWSKTLNVIYIDNPVGTGFSFTENDNGYATNQMDVGKNLYLAVQQFLTLFPQYRENDLYVTGESYAGKYVPALAYTIHEYNKIFGKKINLQGIAIGDGYSDPALMINYSDYLYQIGLIDLNTKAEMKKMEETAVNLIEMGQYELATDVISKIVLGSSAGKTIFESKTGFTYYYNFIHNQDDNTHGDVDHYVNLDAVRDKIHVGNLTYNNGEKVSDCLKADLSKSVRPWFEELLEHYRVVHYSGQLDIIVAYPLTLNFLQSLKWSGADEYKTADRKLWYVDNELAGYTKTVGKFTEILVRNAGHMVPSDQPKWAYDLITRVTRNVPF